MNGTSNNSSKDKSFAADIELVASGVSKNATTEKLADYLKDKGLNVIKCELMTKGDALFLARSFSFKLTIKAEDYESECEEVR